MRVRTPVLSLLRHSILALAVFAGTSMGCLGPMPSTVALAPGASNVELVGDQPNEDVYEPAGEVNAQVVGRETGETVRQAENELRNQAAKRGATFVAIDEIRSQPAWDFSGRVVISMAGTAYKQK